MDDEPDIAAPVDVDFEDYIDLRASLAPLGRWGDDLIDRWDGTNLVRTASPHSDGRRVPYAARLSADRDRLAITIRAADSDLATGLANHVRGTLPTDTAALEELATRDERVRKLRRRHPGIVPVLFPDPLAALIRSISAQQVNLRWATTVRRRIAESYGTRHAVGPYEVWSLESDALAAATLDDLRTRIQLTTAKSMAVIGCARAARAGELEIGDLDALDDEQLIAHLTRLRGIGQWSAEWFLARTLGRPRVVAGDLGVRKAIGRLYATPALPTEAEVRLLTSHWGAAATHAQALVLHDLAVASGAA